MGKARPHGGGGLPPGSGQPPATIRLHSQGLTVAYCQNLLNARIPTPPPLWVDGIFGARTDSRVRQFQSRRFLTIDGIVGPATWGALEAGPPPIRKRPARQQEVIVPAAGGI